MQIESKKKRKMWADLLLGFVPDLTIAFIVTAFSHYGDAGTFFFVFFGLQIVYLLVWIRSSVWTWICYKFRKKQIIQFMLDYFKKNNYPEPDDYIDSSADYFQKVMSDEALPVDLRLKAALEIGGLSYAQSMGQMQNFLRTSLAFEESIEQYKRTFLGASKQNTATQENDPSNSADNEPTEEVYKKIQLVKFKCGMAKGFLDDQKQDWMDADSKKESLGKLEKIVTESLAIAEEVKDEFCKSSILHPIADLLSKAGQFERANKVIDLIAVDFIQEQARVVLTEEKKK